MPTLRHLIGKSSVRQLARVSSRRLVSYLVALILAGSFFKAQEQFGTIRGTVVVVESDRSTSMIPGAAVIIDGRELSRTTKADDKGSWFLELPAGCYQIRANAPGLMGSASVVLDPGQPLDVQIVMSVESVSNR
jgi:hypothetical protein